MLFPFGIPSLVIKIQKKEIIKKTKQILKRPPKPRRLMISSPNKGPRAADSRPETPMIPMERAKRDTGARSEQIVMVAVILIPHPIPVNALKISG